MGRTIAISNQKGGCGKTATAVNLAAGLARQGKRVLVIDADPQSSLTVSLGTTEPEKLEHSLATIVSNVINETDYDNAKHEISGNNEQNP